MTPLQYPVANVPMLGKGLVLFDRQDAAGLATGLLPMGNVSKFGVEIKDDRATLYGSMNQSAALIASALKRRTPTCSITGTDFSADVLAIALMATGKSVNVSTATSYTAEALASATAFKKGRYFRTIHRNHDPLTNYVNTVVKQGATTLVKGTDWLMADGVQGLIYFPSGSAVDESQAVAVDYHTLVATFSQIAGGTASTARGWLHFSPDPTDGQKIELDIWKVDFSPTGTIELITDDYGNWQLDGNILDDSVNHPASPFYLATLLP